MAIGLPFLRRRAAVAADAGAIKAIEDRAMAKAFDAVRGSLLEHEAVRKSYLDGGAAQLASRGGSGVGYGSWGAGNGAGFGGTMGGGLGGNLGDALISRINQNLSRSFGRTPEDLELALAQQGMTWGAPFPPGAPLQPFFGYRTPARLWDYSVGVNTQITPRSDRISFTTLKALWEAYDVAQICTKHLINDVRSLEYHFEAQLGVRDDVSEDVRKAREFFDSPDKRLPFRAWLAKYLMDAIRYDAGTLYIRRNRGGAPIALEVVSGTTMIPQVDYYGRIPTDENDQAPDLTAAGTFHGTKVPGYVQIIQGMPGTWFAADDIIYQPINPMPDSQFGLAPLEAVMLTANTDMRFQWHFLNYFTRGSIPAGFMEAPPDLSNAEQVAEFQQVWDAMMMGDQQKLRQIRWVPHDSKFTPIGSSAYAFDENFPLYLMRRTCAAHGVTPADLGFTDTVNKATSETQVDVQFRVGTLPIVKHVEDVINLFLAEHMKLRVRLRFDTGREIEDRLATAQAMAIYIDHAVVAPEEERARLGYPVDHAHPVGRYINNARNGPIPVNALITLAGKLDPETFAPAKDAKLPDHPFIPAPGVMPPIGSQDAKNADNATAAMQANMVAQNAGKPAPNPDNETTSPPAPAARPSQRPATKGIHDETYAAALRGAVLAWQDVLKDVTAGITAGTGMTGVDLVGAASERDDEDDDDERAEKVSVQLRQWKENSLNRMLRKGERPRRFVSADLPSDVAEGVWGELQLAKTRGDVERIFRAYDPKAQPRSEPGAVKGKTVTAAGIAVVARDTGRVLMLQRDFDDPGKQGAGRWEWPGGRLESDEDPWSAALREWQEETGNKLPKGETTATWAHHGYVCFVYAIANEADIRLNPDAEDMEVKDPDHPKADQTEVMAWWRVKDAKGSEDAMRGEFEDFDWSIVEDATC